MAQVEITRKQLLIFSELPPYAFTARQGRGQIPLAGGRIMPDKGEQSFGFLDPFAVRLNNAICAHSVTVKEAARIVVDNWPAWSDGLSIAETYPSRLGASLAEQIHLIVADIGEGYFTKVDRLDRALKEAPATAKTVLCLNLERMLDDYRAAAAKAGVELPARLTPEFMSAAYFIWREGIDGKDANEAAREAAEHFKNSASR
jgi:hypothetical protein